MVKFNDFKPTTNSPPQNRPVGSGVLGPASNQQVDRAKRIDDHDKEIVDSLDKSRQIVNDSFNESVAPPRGSDPIGQRNVQYAVTHPSPKVDTAPSNPAVVPVNTTTNDNATQQTKLLPYIPPTDDKVSETDNSAPYEQVLAPVKAMQQAMINLSKDISSHNLMSSEDNHNAHGDYLNGSDSFFNFLVNNYTNKASNVGKQLVNVDENQPIRMDTSKKNDNFKGILSSISRIGTPGKGPGSEKIADGVWGPRTNNALNQVAALASTLLKVQQEMGIPISGYSDQDLSQLVSNVPAEPKDIPQNINDKVKKATLIGNNLNKLRELYDNFREKVLNNPVYNAQISQLKPLMIHTKEKFKSNPLNDSDVSLYNTYKSTDIDTVLNGHATTIMPYNLQNMDNFKKFLISKKDLLTPQELDSVSKNDNLTINKFLVEVSNELGKE